MIILQWRWKDPVWLKVWDFQHLLDMLKTKIKHISQMIKHHT